MAVPPPFGIWLREKRLECGLSQVQLATLAGMHRLQVVYLETGRTYAPRLVNRARLARALSTPLPEMFTKSPAPRPIRCGFCARPIGMVLFSFASSVRPGTRICNACLRAANQAAALEARMRNATNSGRVLERNVFVGLDELFMY